MSKVVDSIIEDDVVANNESIVSPTTKNTSIRTKKQTLEAIEIIRNMMSNRISQNIPNNIDLANSLLKVLSNLRSLLNSDNTNFELMEVVANSKFVELIMSNVSSLLRYENVTDECLRVLAPLTRAAIGNYDNVNKDVLIIQRKIMFQMFNSGGIVFVLLALRGYMNTSLGVRLQGLEILSAILEYIALTESDPNMKSNNIELEGIPLKTDRPMSPGFTGTDYQGTEHPRYAGNDAKSSYGSNDHRQQLREVIELPNNSLVQDCIHQMLLHGAGVVLVRLLQYSVASTSEISARRTIWCLQFLLLGTPPSFAVKVGKYDHYACIIALTSQLHASSKVARLEAASLLTALLSADVEICGALTKMGGWDELSGVLAQNAELIHIPSHWLHGSLRNIKLLDEGIPQGTGPIVKNEVNRKGIPGPRNNGADEVSAVETAILNTMESGGSVEDVLQSILKNTNMSARQRAQRHGNRPRSQNGMARSASQNIMGTRFTGIPKGGMSTANLLEKETDIKPPTEKFDIQNTRFAQNLKESPLGQPVDPDKIRELKKKNGGKLPMHIPHALGGPKLGNRPGPDYGSKKKKKNVKGSELSSRPQSSVKRPQNATAADANNNDNTFGPLATANTLNPTPGTLGIDNHLEIAKRSTIKVAKQANYIAKKLFTSTNYESVDDTDANTNTNDEGSSLMKLNFAERLQCMIMQVQDLN